MMSSRLILRASFVLVLLWMIAVPSCLALQPNPNEPELTGTKAVLQAISGGLGCLLPVILIGIIIIHLYERPYASSRMPAASSSPISGGEALDKLIEKLIQRFSAEEMQGLCLELNVDYEQLSDGPKQAKTRALVLQLHREDRIAALLQKCVAARPQVNWHEAGLAK